MRLSASQKELFQSSGNLGGAQQKQHTLPCGASGVAGVLRGLLLAPLRTILEFLHEQFQAGKQYRTVNTFRSAISMTHTELDAQTW